ncbi:HD domain-containing protein [Acetivibrio cellulolyticus]|uniref:HD domain-containing protein n=1 Tax=Acetivibrio cellulolyticus TaxID=35830 RepID=UPI0001E2EB84|nr:HD domain-containing protein [Acetivibrio cellulolyticus]
MVISKVLNKMIYYFGDDVKRINHALKVYGYAKAISGNEQISDKHRVVVELAAILHDIGIKEAERKYNSSAGKYQEMEGPAIAVELIPSDEIEETIIKRVCHLIGNHHSYQKIDGMDFQILVEADFLVNIEEEKLETEVIKSIKEKYFKTSTGQKILESLYGIV